MPTMPAVKLIPADPAASKPTKRDILDAMERITARAEIQVFYVESTDEAAAAFDRIGGRALLSRDPTTGAYELYTPKKTIEQSIVKAADVIEEWEMNINGKAVPAASGL